MHAGINLSAFIEHLLKIDKVYTIVDRAYGSHVPPVMYIPDYGADVLKLDLVGTLGSDVIAGGNYDDVIYGRAGDDHIDGRVGDDFISGGTGANMIFGGAGNDHLDGGGALYGEGGDDTFFNYSAPRFSIAPTPYTTTTIDGGGGNDTATLYFAGYYLPDTIDTIVFDAALSLNVTGGITLTNVETVNITALAGLTADLRGGDGAERFTGTGFLSGGGGADVLRGSGTLLGGDGNDVLKGNGYLSGDAGDDYVVAGNFESYFDHHYLINGLQGQFHGGDGTDTLEFSLYNLVNPVTLDILNINFYTAQITGFERLIALGSRGADRLLGGNLSDSINGSSGGDTIDGRGGSDTLEGGTGADTLLGGKGNDRLSGGEHDDVLDGGAGDDLLYGGSGNDTYYADSAGDVVLDYGANTRDLVRTTLSAYTLPEGVERLVFTGEGPFDGRGNTADNDIQGGSGDDQLHGLAGDDRLWGGAGRDMLSGGQGADTFVLTPEDSTPGDGFGDTIADFVSGEDKIDLTAFSYINFAQQVSYRAVDSGIIVNIDLDGDGFDDADLAIQLTGATGVSEADFLFSNAGGASDHVLFGTPGDDELDGGAGNDRLIGGQGRDLLRGGSGNDVFIFSVGDSGTDWKSRDVIFDFESGVDKIDLTSLPGNSSYLINGDTLQISSDQNGWGDMYIRFKGGVPVADDILL